MAKLEELVFPEFRLNELTNKKEILESTDSSLKNLNKKEINLLDRLISNDVRNQFVSDIHNRSSKKLKLGRCELRTKRKITCAEKPTIVTFVTVLGGKKDRQAVHKGLRVLLDTGCSDSLLVAKYAKKLKKSILTPQVVEK